MYATMFGLDPLLFAQYIVVPNTPWIYEYV